MNEAPPDAPLHLVCLPCGKAFFGPPVKPFNLIENEECEICAERTRVVHVSVFGASRAQPGAVYSWNE